MSEPTPPPTGGMRVVSTRDTRGRRGFETARDMVWSMAAVFLAVVVVLVLAWPPSPDPIRPVEWRPLITAVADSADWPVLAPEAQFDGWNATSARVEPIVGGFRVVHVGWVTDDEQYVSVRQVDLAGEAAAEWLRAEVAGSESSEQPWTDTTGRRWSSYVTDEGVALVTEIAGTTVVVTGTASRQQMQRLAAALVEF